MSRRLPLLAFVAVVLAGLVALLLAAAGDRRSTAFSLDLPHTLTVASLAPGASACQIPPRVPVAFRAVQAPVSPAGPLSLSVSVSDLRGGTRRRLAAGVIHTGPLHAGTATAKLDATVRSGPGVEICLHNRGPSRAVLLGSVASASSGSVRVGRRSSEQAISMMFLRAHPPTLLSMVPTVFDRAALFKASWVGSWTFWALAAALLGALGFGGAAVAMAAGEDAARRDAGGAR